MSYDISGQWRDDLGRPHKPSFSNSCDADSDTTPSAVITASIGELLRLREENQQLREELSRVREQNARLRARIDQRPARDTSTLDDAAHATLADRFRDLVQQDMQHVARQLLCNRTDRDTTQEVAMRISAMCQAMLLEQRDTTHTCLFLGIDPDTYAPLLGGLIVKVKAITGRITPEVWDFHAITGTRLHPNLQRAWGQCEDHHPIRFVVAPAYRTRGRTYAPQLVYTARKPGWFR